MATPSVGAVVLVRFPFSDLSESKLRPAFVLADVGRGDFLLCQITSRRYSDSAAIEILDNDFKQGGLQRRSYIRPEKLFTANRTLIEREKDVAAAEAIFRGITIEGPVATNVPSFTRRVDSHG